MFGWFERRLNPYPAEAPSLPPQGLFAFLWHYTRPAAPWLFVLGCGLEVLTLILFDYPYVVDTHTRERKSPNTSPMHFVCSAM